jgi:hypothetical protein
VTGYEYMGGIISSFREGDQEQEGVPQPTPQAPVIPPTARNMLQQSPMTMNA